MNNKLFSIEDLRGFYKKEVEHGIYSGGFERWLNESNYSLISDGMYELVSRSKWRDRVFKQNQSAIKEIKACKSIQELQRTGL